MQLLKATILVFDEGYTISVSFSIDNLLFNVYSYSSMVDQPC